MRFFLTLLACWLLSAPALAGPLTALGAGKPSTAAAPSLTFINGTTYEITGAGATFSFNCGSCAAGDVLLMMTVNNGVVGTNTINGGSSRSLTRQGSQQTDGTYSYEFYTTVLDANDISTHTITLSLNAAANYAVQVAVYRGGSTATWKVYNSAAASNTLAWTGFSPTGGAVGVVTMSTMYAHASVTVSGASSGATWTFDVQNSPVGGTPFFDNYVSSSPTYSNATVTNTGYGSATIGGFIVEITP